MTIIKKTSLAAIPLLSLFTMGSCKKEASAKQVAPPPVQNISANGAPASLYYTNSSSAMYVVELIGIDSKNVFTSILSPNSNAAKLTLPSSLIPGYYDIVITPEGAWSNTTTKYVIGGIKGAAHQYPATIRKAYISMNDPATIAIVLH